MKTTDVTQNPAAEKSKLRKMYGIGFVSLFLSLSTLIGAPVLPQLSVQLGAPDAWVPVTVAASLVTIVIFQFFTGALADRYSRKKIILIGTLLGCLSSLLILAASDWRQLLALRIAGGIADAIAMPALLSITAAMGEKQPGKFFGILRASQGLSYAIGPLIGGVFSLVSLKVPFLFDGILSLITAVIVLILVTDNVPDRTYNRSILSGLKAIFSLKRTYLYILMGISAMFGFGILSGFVPTQAQIIGLEAWQISLIMSFGAIIYSGTCAVTGILSDRYGRKKFVIFSQVFIVVSALGLVFFGKGMAGLLLFYGLFCAAEAIAFLLSFVYTAKLFNDNSIIGATMGTFDSMIDISLFIGPLVGFLTYGFSSQISYVFLLAGIPAVIGLFVFSIWLKDKK